MPLQADRAAHHRAHGQHRKRRALGHPVVLFVPALAVSAVFAIPVMVGGAAPAAAHVSAAQPGVAPSAGTSAPLAAPVRALPARAGRSSRRASLPATRQAGPAARRADRHSTRQHARAAWVRPDVGRLSSGYGYRASLGDFHPGIDLAGPYGSPIRAAAAGRIVYAGPASGFGQMIRIAHPGGIVTVYGHMSRILRWHGRVRAGQVIALEGSEGRSTGPHLHFEVYVHGQRLDPLPFLRRHGVRI